LITPEQLAVGGSEQAHQKALFCWAALNLHLYPQLKYMYHIPNGGLRGKREAANLKASGVKSGVPDIHLPAKCGQYGGLYLELKKIKGGSVSPEQKDWIDFLTGQGYAAYVVKGWIEAKSCLEWYLKLPR